MPIIAESVRDFLTRQRVGHLATVSPSGEPHVVPVCYAFAEDTIYTPIDQKPKQPGRTLQRVRNILATGRAALVVDRYDDDWTKLGWVLLRGKAELLDPPAVEHQRAIELLRQRYPQYRTMRLEERPIIALRVERVTQWGNLE